jgi:hypothetical protein
MNSWFSLGLRAACCRFGRDILPSGGGVGEKMKKIPGALECWVVGIAAGCTQSKVG